MGQRSRLVPGGHFGRRAHTFGVFPLDTDPPQPLRSKQTNRDCLAALGLSGNPLPQREVCVMAMTIRRVNYFHTTAEDRPGSAYQVLAELAEAGISLLAFDCVPVGPTRVQFTLFPEEPTLLEERAGKVGLELTPRQGAFLVQGDDEVGTIADVHRQLYDARINVYACRGVSDGRGAFGYLIHVRPEEYDRAAGVLEI